MIKIYLSLILVCLLTTIGQILIKLGSDRICWHYGFKKFIVSFVTPYVLFGVISTLTAPLFYFYSLTKLPLSFAYAFTGFNYILIIIASHFFLKETAFWYHWLGGFIFIGILFNALNLN